MNSRFLFTLLLALAPCAVFADRNAPSELPPGAQEEIDKWMEQVRTANERRAKLREEGIDPATMVPPETPPFEIQPLPPQVDTSIGQPLPGAIKWPSSAVASMDAQVKTFLFDGFPISRLIFSSGDWLWAMPVLTDFDVRQDRGPASVRLENTLFPDTEIQFSFFPGESFLPDIEPDSIEGYIKGLREQHGRRIQLPNETIAANTRVPINGSIWWNIPYTLVDPEGQRPDVTVVDYIFKIEPYLVVVRHSGPARTVRAGTNMLQDALRRSYTPTEPPQEIAE